MGAIAGFFGSDLMKQDLTSAEKTLEKAGCRGIERLKDSRSLMLHSLMSGRDRGCSCLHGEIQGKTYGIVFSGKIYNEPELQRELGDRAAASNTAMLLLTAYHRWGESFVKMLNGVFSLAILEQRTGRLFLARDPMGGKPLFYHQSEGRFLFASSHKTILSVPGQNAELDAQGALELIMLSPGRKPDSGILKGIRQLEPGCWAVYENGVLQIRRYWQPEDGVLRDSFEEISANVRYLLEDAFHLQTRDLKKYGTFLSGGLDSSILSALAARQQAPRRIRTFSVDYLHNDVYFTPGKFQPNSDSDYVQTMVDALKSRHRNTVITPEQLVEALEDAASAREFPGMGDVDASLLIFCREVKKHVPVVFSGECADEIFGGYPWYRDPELRGKEGFPWANNSGFRKGLLAFPGEEAEDFVMDCWRETCASADIAPETGEEDIRIKKLVMLNMRWFMQTLVERNTSMSGAAGLEIRVPFCDVRIADYLYRVPWAYKDWKGREKGLLRHAVSGLIPEVVRLRKKSPYPKTFDPRYGDLITSLLQELLLKDAPVWHLISRERIREILQKGTMEPFYGQLMRLPQFAAWVLQVNLWLEHDNVRFTF